MDLTEDVLSEGDLAVIESVIQFTIERMESRGDLHDAEKQSLKTLKELKIKIERVRLSETIEQ